VVKALDLSSNGRTSAWVRTLFVLEFFNIYNMAYVVIVDGTIRIQFKYKEYKYVYF
jgi:hypothetical protein